LQDRRQADQHHQQFKQVCQTAIANKFSMAQKQIAPKTTIIRTPIKAESMANPLVLAW
jgi:hypothetical protein